MLTITNSTIADNHEISDAGGGNDGAGVFATGASGVTIANSTIANNTQQNLAGGTASGSAVHSVAATPFTLVNNTIAGNSGGKSPDGQPLPRFHDDQHDRLDAAGGNCSTAFNSAGHNLETADECGFHSAGDKATPIRCWGR